MNERIECLRKESFETSPSVSIERAVLTTEFYRENEGKYPIPILRAKNFYNLCEKKTIYIGDRELIVGERGPRPKAVSTFPELNCHTAEDFEILNSRPMTRYTVAGEDIRTYSEKVVPFWKGRTLRDRIFSNLPQLWLDLYEGGCFTEFMEQRAPGHTALDGTIYRTGLLEFKSRIARAMENLDWINDPQATEKNEELQAMDIACDAVILFAERHAELAEKMAEETTDPERKAELLKIADVCRHVPAHAPRDFHEAVQTYWFTHLGTITELNGWDAMSPGHFDQHLAPFFEKGTREGTLDREKAKELLSCFWIKVNNTPAPPKVGVTAAESGTYNDFTQINLGGVTEDGADGVSEVSYLLLDVLDELQLLQPQASVHISSKTPERFLRHACRIMRRGSGYPSAFNSEAVVMEQLGMGKRVEDARTGGTSGCVETGSFGKEAYILHGYLNVPKILELTLNNGTDPLTGKMIGIASGDPMEFHDFDDLYRAFEKQLIHVVNVKIRTDNYIQRMFARHAPAPYLSVLIHDCIKNGKDYYDGGARYNTDYIQCCGIGTVTDSLSVLKKHVFQEGSIAMESLMEALKENWKGHDELRQFIWNRTPFFGNDDEYADSIMQRVYGSLLDAIDGKRSPKGPTYHVNMLSTTCHIYFGKKLGATPNGRFAHVPESDGTSPSHGADRRGPTAVVKSLSKMNQVKSGGTLLNQRFLPSVLDGDGGLEKMAGLIRTYFNLGGHHIQFNVVDTETLRKAQKNPDEYRGLLVRVAGYSDYFVDLDDHHQEEIIARTAQESF
ncbi:MAG TPA: glycyl radical protein [Aminivibrio sp.]|jgi:formate C-acetyltransferase|uniref:trans-4-hydroxy-L-proline dehydratase n=1 Tax=Aminivibrio sp. TaxID=1872489 RepID=UPI002D19C438|nr:trans-4-hydroxy-L-proline dehydratase [Aminivibrio sp.]HPF83968.1 glycyl radical protein [Aminivibrio sp.]HRX25168.1 glycyl radical protein [Aminivibrio sp.]